MDSIFRKLFRRKEDNLEANRTEDTSININARRVPCSELVQDKLGSLMHKVFKKRSAGKVFLRFTRRVLHYKAKKKKLSIADIL